MPSTKARGRNRGIDTAPETPHEHGAGLDRVSPDTNPARDAGPFRRIIAARRRVAEADAELHAAVRAARDAGDSWTVIGAALDVSRQAAYDRFGRDRRT